MSQRHHNQSQECPRDVRANDVFAILAEILRFQGVIMTVLTDLQAAVAAATGVDGDAVALINSLKAQVADLQTQLAAAQADSGTPDSALQPLVDSLGAGTASLAAVAPHVESAPSAGATDAPVDAAPAA